MPGQALTIVKVDVNVACGAEAACKPGLLVVENNLDAESLEHLDLFSRADNGNDLAALVGEGNLGGNLRGD